jgi:hypothetical protein
LQEGESIPVEKSYPHPVAKRCTRIDVDIKARRTVIFAPFRASLGRDPSE